MTTRYSLDVRGDYMATYEKDNLGNDFRIDAYFTTLPNGSGYTSRLCKFTDVYELNDNVISRPADIILGINMIRIPEMYYILAETMLKKDPATALQYYNKVREHRGLEPLEVTTDTESIDSATGNPFTLQHINEERFKEYFGEGQLFFNMKRLNQDITSYDGATVYEASKDIYVVPTPDIEKENRD